MHSFNVHFAQAQTHNNNRVAIALSAGFIEALNTKTPISARISIPQGRSWDRLAIFTNYPNVTKDQALEETVLTLFYLDHPVVQCYFQLVESVLCQYNLTHRLSECHQKLTLQTKSTHRAQDVKAVWCSTKPLIHFWLSGCVLA